MPWLRWSVGDSMEGYRKLPGLGSCCCDECAWNVISNTCHIVTPHATTQTFSLRRKENLLSNHSGPKDIPTLYPKNNWFHSAERGADGQNWEKYIGTLEANGYM